VVRSADISLNTEIETLKNYHITQKQTKKFIEVIVMVELGDLREGVLPCDFLDLSGKHFFSHIKIVGIGCNLACYGGVKPDDKNMHELSRTL
jgi:predicted amino acid racemase